MQNIQFKKYSQGSITQEIAEVFVELLKEQGKVQNPNVEKILECREICICYVDEEPAAIGAIKPKTDSVFKPDKANLESMGSEFEWELGYCYTRKKYRNQGLSSNIVRMLLADMSDYNLMASTEIRHDNSMIKILEKHGFRLQGQPWMSAIHGGLLGLFIRVSDKTGAETA